MTGWKVPSPLPSSTPVALSWLLTVTRSGRPSPLTSATTVWTGDWSVAKVCCAWKVPSPLFSRTLTAVVAVVGGDDVGLAVAVDVRHRDRVGPGADGEGLLGLEGAVAVAQQHAHRVVEGVGGDEVGDAVAVDVRHRHRERLPAGGEGLLRRLRRCRRPLPSSTLTVSLAELATTRSGLPSPLRSATATRIGLGPDRRRPPAAAKVPSPLPSSTLTVSSL